MEAGHICQALSTNSTRSNLPVFMFILCVNFQVCLHLGLIVALLIQKYLHLHFPLVNSYFHRIIEVTITFVTQKCVSYLGIPFIDVGFPIILINNLVVTNPTEILKIMLFLLMGHQFGSPVDHTIAHVTFKYCNLNFIIRFFILITTCIKFMIIIV